MTTPGSLAPIRSRNLPTISPESVLCAGRPWPSPARLLKIISA
jgi:hypothetical protein